MLLLFFDFERTAKWGYLGIRFRFTFTDNEGSTF